MNFNKKKAERKKHPFRFLKGSDVEDRQSNVKVNEDGAGIHDGGDKGGSHDGRIQLALFRYDGEHTADHLRHADGDKQADAHSDGDEEILVEEPDPQDIDGHQ